MNKQQKAKWVKALRSGQYKQGRLKLKDNSGGYCCLGVANEVFDLRVNPNYGTLDDDFLSKEIQYELIEFNDGCEMPFDLIAGFIDTYIEADLTPVDELRERMEQRA